MVFSFRSGVKIVGGKGEKANRESAATSDLCRRGKLSVYRFCERVSR